MRKRDGRVVDGEERNRKRYKSVEVVEEWRM
jgi:hypothetical protein